MITIQHTQESLNRAFISALAGCAGVNWVNNREFDYGIDGTFRPIQIVGKRRVESGFPLDFQLKCTYTWEHKKDKVIYKLEKKTYNDIVGRDPEGVGFILIVLCVPKDQTEWASFTESSMILKNCCYYSYLTGSPLANNNGRKTLAIPRTNVLTSDSLKALLSAERVRKLGSAA